jgi:hypothetical protein
MPLAQLRKLTHFMHPQDALDRALAASRVRDDEDTCGSPVQKRAQGSSQPCDSFRPGQDSRKCKNIAPARK